MSSILYIVATTILMFAAVALKPSLRVSPIPREGAPLISHGIYRWINHPMYVGVMLFATGMALGNLNWITTLLWCALLATLVTKAKFENSLLRERHAGSPEAAGRFTENRMEQ